MLRTLPSSSLDTKVFVCMARQHQEQSLDYPFRKERQGVTTLKLVMVPCLRCPITLEPYSKVSGGEWYSPRWQDGGGLTE